MEAAISSAMLSSAMSAGPLSAATVAGIQSTAGMISSGIMGGFSLLSSVASGAQQSYALQAQAEGIKAQAYQERLKAREEAAIRRERLLKALSAQNAMTGAGGVSGGSIEALKLESMKAYSREQRSADLMTNLGQDTARQKVASLTKQGNQAFGASLLSSATKLASIG